jgi:large subunit ribosomal protein L23
MAEAPKKPATEAPPAVERQRGDGPTLEPHQIILKPLVTEKGTHQSSRHNAYTFKVNSQADKHQIQDAIEELFHVRVVKVRTANRLGKRRRFKGKPGLLSDWKKAVITLHEEDRLEFF